MDAIYIRFMDAWTKDVMEVLLTNPGIARVRVLACEASESPERLDGLLDACRTTNPKNRDMRAAWVLHHAYRFSAVAMQLRIEQIMDVLDASGNLSVHRELLKVIAEMPRKTLLLSEKRSDLWELGVAFLYDDSAPKGLHYIGMRLAVKVTEDDSEREELIVALTHRRDFSAGSDTRPLRTAIDRTLDKMRRQAKPG